MRNKTEKSKFIINNEFKTKVGNINAYLLNTENIYINKRNIPISNISPINYGSFALDDGNYTLSLSEKEALIAEDINALKYIRPFIGAKELLNGIERYCIWLSDVDDVSKINSDSIKARVDKVKKWRVNSERTNTVALAATPHIFAEIRQPNSQYMAFPTVSSERRKYIPVRFLTQDIIASNQLYVIPDSEIYLFSILTSLMHNVWIKAVGGRIKTDYRYSAAICYNNFPVTEINNNNKKAITQCGIRILDEREKYSELTMAQLYDPDKMPEGLREAHKLNDIAVERCYRAKPFDNDKDRLEHLFRLYENMIADEEKKGTLFQQHKKPRKRKKSNA